ncbi:ArnT family glycosyltransferase, partial [Mangrovactinospora gilvigrisea]|uniref:ArnT family glycosyltransferase n=1 Tax=Mangrovactinospora gilvigrisea TaxID=1428644 RepID=UPI0011148B9A
MSHAWTGPTPAGGPAGPDTAVPESPGEADRRGAAAAPVRVRDADPRWARPALLAILVVAAALYLWGITSGSVNTYYSAAVYSATKSWKAWFFGSLDAGSFITVDKPPLSTMVQGLFCRVFGFGTWQQLLPMALASLGSIAVLHAAVKRAFGAVPGLVAALVMAVTPIAVAITRDNNPDPILVLLMVSGVWAVLRAVSDGKLRWLVLCAVFFGLAFNAKMLQAFIPLPAVVGVYLYAGPGGWWRRVRQLLVAAVPLIVVAFSWMFAVDRIPASSRPFIGGSGSTNSVWNLVIGYNGLGRIFGG